VPSGLWVIDNFTPRSYFHWITECLPRLVLAEERYPDEHVLLLPRYYDADAYIPFTLQAFPKLSEIGWVGKRAKARVDRLAFVPQPRPNNIFVPELLHEVARRVGALAGEPPAARRIYFSRDAAERRRAANEREVIRLLREHDFEIVTTDPSKPEDQIRVSRGANVIAGVHGADLTNLMFMPPGGHVLELRHAREEVFVDCYRPLSHAMGQEYRAQICELARDAPGRDINHVDLIVDLDLLRENLGAIG
jgi:capsular polysaccharide biosynthesis protein